MFSWCRGPCGGLGGLRVASASELGPQGGGGHLRRCLGTASKKGERARHMCGLKKEEFKEAGSWGWRKELVQGTDEKHSQRQGWVGPSGLL